MILGETENAPAMWPEPPDGLSAAAAAIPEGAVWSRLEKWITRRWGKRGVKWIIEGPCEFIPRLTPAALDTAKKWGGMSTGWETTTPANGPQGLILGADVYKLTFNVGETSVPPSDVLEAYRRIAEYWAEAEGDAGFTSVTDGDFSLTRSANAMGRALQYSGAADLLRAYR